MPYARSTSRQRAAQRLGSLRRSFVYAKLRTRQLPSQVRESIFYNCLFQLSATFEDFLADLLTSWFTRVRALPASSSLLPNSTRATIIARSLSEAFRIFVAGGDEARLASAIEANGRTISILQSGADLTNIDFAELLIKDKRFPSVRNVDRLFQRVGVHRFFGEVSRRTGTDFPLALQSFMDVRNAIAHENPPNITDQDVERYFANLESWIAAVDRTMYSHVVAMSGAQHWPS